MNITNNEYCLFFLFSYIEESRDIIIKLIKKISKRTVELQILEYEKVQCSRNHTKAPNFIYLLFFKFLKISTTSK